MGNTEWIQQFAPQYTGGLRLGTSGDDGSGIALAQSVGAVTERMDNVSAWRFITPPSAFISAVIVDERGRRIIDESRYGAAVGHAMVRHHGGKGWILVDAALLKEARRQMIKQPLWFQRAQSAAMMLLDSTRGASLREVAERAGVDPDGLVATVEAHNHAIDTGAADPAGKPADFVRRVSKPPYTLLNISIRPNLLNPTPMLTLGESASMKAPERCSTSQVRRSPACSARGVPRPGSVRTPTSAGCRWPTACSPAAAPARMRRLSDWPSAESPDPRRRPPGRVVGPG